MSTHTVAPRHLDRPGVRDLSLGGAVATEAAKLVDTRASRAVIIAGVALMAAFAGGRAVVPSDTTAFGTLFTMALMPAGLATMVLAVLSMTAEFSQRTASITFTLDPRRGRVLAAKGLVVAAAVAGSSLLAAAFAGLLILTVPLVTRHAIGWDADPVRVAAAVGANALLALAAMAWGLLTRSAPAALVLLLVWPTFALLIRAVSPEVADALAYVSLDAPFLLADQAPNAAVKVCTSVAAWGVLPGVWAVQRLLKADLS